MMLVEMQLSMQDMDLEYLIFKVRQLERRKKCLVGCYLAVTIINVSFQFIDFKYIIQGENTQDLTPEQIDD